MDFSDIPSLNRDHQSEPRFGIRVGTLLAILVMMGLAGWGLSEYFSPKRVWRRTIHDPARLAKAWAEVEREHTIEGLTPAATLPLVFEAMVDPDPAIRGWAVWCVPSLKGDAVEILEKLAMMLGDPDQSVRIRVAEALGQVYRRKKPDHPESPGRPEALGALEIALKDGDALVRKAAVGSVGQVVYESGTSSDPLRSGQKDDPALEMVEARLNDSDLAVRVEAAFVLGCNDRGGESVPMLVKLIREQPLDQPISYIANRAFMALTILAVRSEAAVDFLAAEMSVKRESYPDRPRDALAWAARQAPQAHVWVRKQAREALKSADPAMRIQAAFLMFDIGLGVEALDQLVEALHDDSVEIRIRTVQALGEIGENDVRAMEGLLAATRDSDTEVRLRALGALEEIELEKNQ